MVRKSEIVERITGEASVTKHPAENAAGAVFAATAGAPAHGKDIAIASFRTVSRKSHPARWGRNPSTASLP